MYTFHIHAFYHFSMSLHIHYHLQMYTFHVHFSYHLHILQHIHYQTVNRSDIDRLGLLANYTRRSIQPKDEMSAQYEHVRQIITSDHRNNPELKERLLNILKEWGTYSEVPPAAVNHRSVIESEEAYNRAMMEHFARERKE